MKARVSIVAASSIAASESASPDHTDLAGPRVQELLEHHSTVNSVGTPPRPATASGDCRQLSNTKPTTRSGQCRADLPSS